jgi:hypothetical protein
MKKFSRRKEKNTSADDERILMWRKSIEILVLRIKECYRAGKHRNILRRRKEN